MGHCSQFVHSQMQKGQDFDIRHKILFLTNHDPLREIGGIHEQKIHTHRKSYLCMDEDRQVRFGQEY